MITKLVVLLLPLVASAQIRAQFSDPNRPGTIRVDIVTGGITVTGTSGKDVVIETQGGQHRGGNRDVPQGMRRVGGGGSGIEVREENNMMRIDGDGMGFQNLTIQVPTRTSIIVKTVNNGAIVVENVEGEIEAQNVNGAIRLTGISGSVVANTVNGKIETTLVRATPGKPMSFTTLNGPIDVTLPADIKATLKMKADNGDIFTDFDITVRDERTNVQTGRGRWRSQTMTVGAINGGGPEIHIQSTNGKIYVRKK